MAQRIARLTSDQKVGGSNPSGVDFWFLFIRRYTRQEYYGSSFDFNIYLVVTWENNCWDCKTALPKNIDF